MKMLSTSLPDLREDADSSSSGPSSECHKSAFSKPSKDGETAEKVTARPGSAPATKFYDGDSGFEGEKVDREEDDPTTAELSNIFSVLSVDENPGLSEANIAVNANTESTTLTDTFSVDENFTGQSDSEAEICRPSAFKSRISVIAEVSGEDSDYGFYASKNLANSAGVNMRNSLASPSRYVSGQQRNASAEKTKPKPRLLVSTTDDSSSDSDSDTARYAMQAAMARRNSSAMYRRRHSLAVVTPDQITRLLLSQRRGSSDGLTAPPADGFQSNKPDPDSTDDHPRLPTRSSSKSSRRDSQQLLANSAPFPQLGVSGRRGSFSIGTRSAIRTAKAHQDLSLDSTTHLRPVSPESITATCNDSQRIASPYRGSTSSPENLSPSSGSPRLMRQKRISARGEIESISPQTQPQTPPRSPSPRLSPTSCRQDHSASSSLKVLSKSLSTESDSVSLRPRIRARSPAPKQDRHARSSRRHSCIGDTASSLREFQRRHLGLSLGNSILDLQSRLPRPRSPSPTSQRPKNLEGRRPSINSASNSPQLGRRAGSRRKSSATDLQIEQFVPGLQPRRSSNASLATDDSDENSNLDPDRTALKNRRKRRGSRANIVLGDSDATFVPPAGRWSRRSSICVPHPTQGDSGPTPRERAEIAARLGKRGSRRSSWAGAGATLLKMSPVSALSLLRENNNEEDETEQTKDAYALTLHFITDPGQSQPLRTILRPLIESVVPKLNLFNFVERGEATDQDTTEDASPSTDSLTTVPTLGVVLLLQEEFGMERILEAQNYLKSEPWELHHRGKVGSNNVPYPTNNQDFYAHQSRLDSALWAVRQVHLGKDRLRFQLFVSNEKWGESIDFYSELLSRTTHVRKDDFCYFLVFCSKPLNLEVQLALKKLPAEYKPQVLESTILQFKVGDIDELASRLPRRCIQISDKRWQTADPDGNKVLLFKDGDSHITSPDAVSSSKNGLTASFGDDWLHEADMESAV